MSQLEFALNQIRAARLYTQDLLRHIDGNLWFRMPSEGVTTVAWQVGHLAVAEYGLALRRVRGEKPDDDQLLTDSFRQQFGKGSIPGSGESSYPTIQEIRAVFDQVHHHVLEEISGLSDKVLDEPAGDPPHRLFATKLGALHWCARHEFIHAGQLALLRRLFGAAPLR